jgi:hypothetical protein
VIFTGRATTEYMKEEHPLEYERASREGQLQARIAPAASRSATVWSIVLGFTALGVGIALIILVVWALLH